MRIKCLSFKPPSLWHSVIAVEQTRAYVIFTVLTENVNREIYTQKKKMKLKSEREEGIFVMSASMLTREQHQEISLKEKLHEQIKGNRNDSQMVNLNVYLLNPVIIALFLYM